MASLSKVYPLWYFMYGSNLQQERLERRIAGLQATYCRKVSCVLEDYDFAYNKLSNDGTSKGNIFAQKGSRVYGIAIQMTEGTLNRFIEKYERGYEKHEVTLVSVDAKYPERFRAVTCISNILTDARPSDEYVGIVVEGARQNKLPVGYIEKKLGDVR